MTASELAYVAGVSPQTTSEHLAMLREANLLSLTKQGRHCYFRLGSPQVRAHDRKHHGGRRRRAAALSAALERRRQLRTARTCYDHIAGRLGVALTDALDPARHVCLAKDGGMVTRAGEKFLAEFGITIADPSTAAALSAGRVSTGASGGRILPARSAPRFAERCFELGWVARVRDSRALKIPPKGERGFKDAFGISLAAEQASARRESAAALAQKAPV